MHFTKGQSLEPCQASRARDRRRGFKLVDLCVVLCAVALLVAAVPALRQNAREQSNRIACAANLQSLAQHGFMYANNDAWGEHIFPRTYYDPGADLDKRLRGGSAVDPSAQSYDLRFVRVVGVNNTMASFYQLLKATDLPMAVFICPSTEAQVAYFGNDIQRYSNWPASYAEFNSYSYSCPFPTQAARRAGWRFDRTAGPDFPFASDINPGIVNNAGPVTVAATDDRAAMQPGNSPNHWYDGQNIAYCDGHVEWQESPFAGARRATRSYRDNIFTTESVTVNSNGKGGAMWEKPADPQDAVMLPTGQDSPGSAIAARLPGMSPPMAPMLKFLIIGAAVTLVAVLFIVWQVKRKPTVSAWHRYRAGLAVPVADPLKKPQVPDHSSEADYALGAESPSSEHSETENPGSSFSDGVR